MTSSPSVIAAVAMVDRRIVPSSMHRSHCIVRSATALRERCADAMAARMRLRRNDDRLCRLGLAGEETARVSDFLQVARDQADQDVHAVPAALPLGQRIAGV